MRAPERVGDVGDPGLVGDGLLGPQGQPRGFFRGQSQRLVPGVGVQRLGSPEHRRKSLEGDANDVDVRLLGGQCGARRLGMEAKPPGTRILRAVPVPGDLGPQGAGSPELGDLLEEV